MSTRTGPLDPVKIYKVFRSLLDQQLSGHLVFTRGQITKRLRVMNGQPVRVVSNARRESVQAALQEQGFLAASDVERVNALRETDRISPDEALIKLGLLDLGRLRSLENRLARRRLLELFTWREGEYTFTPTSLHAEPEDEPIDLITTLVEAAARVTPDDECQKFCAQFGGQIIRLTPWSETYGAAFDAAFGSPNIRHSLVRASTIDELVAQLRDPERVSRQVFTLIISGLAVFQKMDAGLRPVVPAPTPAPQTQRPATGKRPASGPLPQVPLRGNPQAVPLGQGTPRPVSTRPPATTPVTPRTEARVASSPAAAVKAPAPTVPTRAPKPMDEKGRAGLVEVDRIHVAMRTQTYYELLLVAKSADFPTIRNQFRKLARDFHVDRFTKYGLDPDSLKKVQEVFMGINRAHEVLTDVEKRKEYDLQIEMGARGQRLPSGGGGPDIGAIFRSETLVRDGVMSLRNGNPVGAKAKFEEALAASPGDVVSRSGAAFADFLIAHGAGKNGEAEKARARLEELVSENPSREEPYLYLGRIYRTRNDTARAVAMFKRSLEVNPRCTEAASELRHLQRKETPPDKGQGGLFGKKKA